MTPTTLPILPPRLAEAKATAQAALASREAAAEAERRQGLEANRSALAEAALADLPADLLALAGGAEQVIVVGADFSGATTCYWLHLTIAGHHPLQAAYQRSGPVWVRALYDNPSDDPLNSAAPPLWRICRPHRLLHARTIGSALALAEKTEAELAREEMDKNIPF